MTDTTDIFEQLRTAYRSEPDNVEVGTRLAEHYTDLGWFNEAKQVYQELLVRAPDNYSILLAFGNLCYSRKENKEALAAFSKLTVIKPDRVEGWNNLGILQLASEDYDAAKKSFQKVLALEPQNQGALLNLGNYYDHIGDSDRAIAMFKQAAAARPDFIDAWFNLGNAYTAKGHYEKAIDMYKKTLKYDPKFFSAFKNIGFACEQLKDYARAEENYQHALAINKADAQLYVNMATVAMKQEQYEKAKDYYLRGVAIAPHEAGGWLGLRELSLKKGDLKTYVKSTLAILHRLDAETVAGALVILRRLGQWSEMKKIVAASDKLGQSHIDLDAERMLVYQRSEKDVPKAVSLYKKLSSGIPGCSDHVLHCLAAYALEKGQYDSVISHIQAMREKTIAEEKMLWAALIEKKKYADAEKLIHAYVHDHRDCFDGWYFLAKINIHYGKSGYAREYLKQALDAGYIDLDALNNDKELREVYRALS